VSSNLAQGTIEHPRNPLKHLLYKSYSVWQL